MITRDEFIQSLVKGGARRDSLETKLDNFENCAQKAVDVSLSMPGIGFGSVTKRINCFYAVCRHLDSMIDRHEIDDHDAQIILNILRLKNKKFRKAITMFDLRGTRATARERTEMPQVAREYLAGLEFFG